MKNFKPAQKRTQTEIKNWVSIKSWLIENELSIAGISREVGLSRQLVSMVISGHRRNQKVVDKFLEKGCPAKYFGQESER